MHDTIIQFDTVARAVLCKLTEAMCLIPHICGIMYSLRPSYLDKFKTKILRRREYLRPTCSKQAVLLLASALRVFIIMEQGAAHVSMGLHL